MNKQGLSRVLIMAGGTGGHVFPALALANALRDEGIEVHWLGTEKGIEARVVPEQQFAIHYLNVAGIRGQGVMRLLKAPFTLSVAVFNTLKLINTFKPDLVVGMGGFVTGPGGMGAWLSGVPVVIHEQNAVPGFTNKLLARIAKCVLQGFPGAFGDDSETVITTGNPVRSEILNISAPSQRFAERRSDNWVPRILVVGGSQGAVALNRMVPEALQRIAKTHALQIRHQAGPKNRDDTAAFYEELLLDAEVVPFLDDMAAAYAWADFVICRSGALTVAELAAAGVGAVLIPYPFAVDDHQTANGHYLVEQGAALMVQQNAIDSEGLAEMIGNQLLELKRLEQMACAARSLAKPDATAQAIAVCKRVVGEANGS